jgi:hypothetical protein
MTARVDGLESQVASLEEEMKQQEQEATDAITSWEAQCIELEEKLGAIDKNNIVSEECEKTIKGLSSDLESKNSAVSAMKALVLELQKQIELQDQASKDAEERVASLERKLKETEELFNSRLEASISEHARAEESVDSQRLLDREKLEKLETERDIMLNEKASLEQERDALKNSVAELVDELHEANDAMQLFITSEVSEKAAKLAADVLREQIDDMRDHAEADRSDCLAERQARHTAEHEARRLRADLAALLGMENTDENHAEIQRHVVEAKGSLQRKERIEIEAIKKSLNQALEELASARTAEKEAEERAARVSLQVSMYEQDLVTARTDFKFLTQTMDEMREAESTKREALEYRISSLENDQNVLRRLHYSETEILRNELNQVSMERDRIFQSLRESEKSKEALLQASSRGNQAAGDSELEVEVLRMEKAQLLSAAGEEASRFERRLREAVAADRSSSEADLFVEKELRLSTERALETLKLEMTDLRKELSPSKRSDTVSGTREQDLEKEINEFKKQIKTLVEHETALEAQLTASKEEAEKKMERLSEECRLAKTRAVQLERDGRYEAEVRAEVTRLQTAHPSHNSGDFDSDPAEDSDDANESLKITKMYDAMQQQKQAMEEDHAVYLELVAEHDDLLALLAQQDLIKACMDDALSRLGGQEAVDSAVHEAEEKAIAQYGKFVRIG